MLRPAFILALNLHWYSQHNQINQQRKIPIPQSKSGLRLMNCT